MELVAERVEVYRLRVVGADGALERTVSLDEAIEAIMLDPTAEVIYLWDAAGHWLASIVRALPLAG